MAVPPRDYLLLWEAFDALGRQLYSREWSGNELDIDKPSETYEQLVEAREPLERRREVLLERADSLGEERRTRTHTKEKIEALKAEEEALRSGPITGIANELSLIPRPEPWIQERDDAYKRRLETERQLIRALASDEFPARVARGASIEARLWDGRERFFGWRIEGSLVRLPMRYGRHRLQTATINRGKFETWLHSKVEPIVPPAEVDLSPREQCDRALIEMRDGPIPTKSEILEKMQNLIPGLSKNDFNRSWDQNAPISWKRPGPKSSKRSERVKG